MTDQAAQLRAMMAARKPDRIEPAGPPTIVVGSGKGGVGKSVISALLAQRLATWRARPVSGFGRGGLSP